MFSTYVSHRETRLNAEVRPTEMNYPASRQEVTGCRPYFRQLLNGCALLYSATGTEEDVGAWNDIRSGCQLYIPTVLPPEEADPLVVGLEIVWVYVSV